jgi:sodium/hydrogen exchanger 8
MILLYLTSSSRIIHSTSRLFILSLVVQAIVFATSDGESNLKAVYFPAASTNTSKIKNEKEDKGKYTNPANVSNEFNKNEVIQLSNISKILNSSATPDKRNSTIQSLGAPIQIIDEDSNSSSTSVFVQNNEIVNVTNTSTTTVAPALAEPVLPDKGSAEEEHNNSMSIFFVLCVLALGILLIHLMLQTNFQYLPESVVIVFLGGAIGMIINLMSHQNIANWKKEETFSPTAFFLVLLPPIIFESGYNLHKGNFFQNIGSIMVFAIFGTAISAFVIGAGIYLLGLAQVAYKLSFVESFAFGSLISAVDPVATVAIFHALDVDPVLNMLVFGESILNDAISIVLTTSVLESNNAGTTSEAIILCINRFCLMFFASAGIGVVFALMSALLLKHVDLRKNPSLEFALMLVSTYAPYVLAEGIQLSGNKSINI